MSTNTSQKELLNQLKEKLRRAPRFPLSVEQNRIWSLQKNKDVSTNDFHLRNTFSLRGDLNLAKLETAFNTLIERHTILRSYFVLEKGIPTQLVSPIYRLRILFQDVQEESEESIKRTLQGLAEKPFQLTRELPIRVSILKTSDATHLLNLVIHQLVFDGGSWGTFLSELSDFYSVFSKNIPPKLKALPLQYGEYAKWQQQNLDHKENLAKQEYWRRIFSDPVPQLKLPTDYVNKRGVTNSGAVHTRNLPPALGNAIEVFARDQQCSVFVIFLAIYQLLLARYSHQTDVTVFFSTSGRGQDDLRSLIGLFANLVPIRNMIVVEDEPDSIFQAVKRATQEALLNELPLSEVVDSIQIAAPIKPSLRVNLFQCMFAFHSGAIPSLCFDGLETEHLQWDTKVSQFDLLLVAHKRQGKYRLEIQYNEDLFCEQTADKICQFYQQLLESTVGFFSNNHEVGTSKSLNDVLAAIDLHSDRLQELRQVAEDELAATSDTLAFAPPETIAEQKILQIWRDVLSIQGIGVTDNFFHLGGHSIAAAKVVARVADTFNVNIPLADLFIEPTIRHLASLVQGQSSANTSTLIPLSPDSQRPLSYSQRRLWFIDQLDHGSTQYNIPISFTLSGNLDLTAFEATVAEIVQRHQVLRTRIFHKPKENLLFQEVVEDCQVPISKTDLSSLARHDQMLEWKKLIDEDLSKPFKLDKESHIRVQLAQFSDREHKVLMTMHHIASDGWSVGVLYREFSSLYAAFADGRTTPLAQLEVQYADYAAWQQEWLKTDSFESELAYWKRTLSGIPTVHQLPLDKPRPKEQSFAGARQTHSISEATTQLLRDFCQKHDVTMFVFLHSVFALLLSRYSNEKDIVIGAPVAGRHLEKLEPLIGFFVNTLPLRTQIQAGTSFLNFLAGNKAAVVEAFQNQHLPFELLVEELQPERNLAFSPIFQILLVLQNSEALDKTLPSLKLTNVEYEGTNSRFDLEMSITERQDSIQLVVSYSTHLFFESTIRRLASNFEALCENILRCPHEEISKLEIVSPQERRYLISDWSHTLIDPGKADACIHDFFESQAHQQPDAPAVIYETAQGADSAPRESQSLSYAGLNTQANKLAHYLISQGVVPGALVGLYFERSIEMVVAILGILKAGGAYIAIDPAYPDDRVEYMLRDSNAHLVVTHTLLSNRPPLRGYNLVILDDPGYSEKTSTFPDDNVDRRALGLKPEDLAFIIYTSGTTGKPKGVMQCHRTMTNLVNMQQVDGDLVENYTTLQFASIGFDASIHELTTAWKTGAAIVCLPKEDRLDLDVLLNIIFRHQVGRMFIPPAMLYSLANKIHSKETRASSLRELVLAGEQLRVTNDVKRLLKEKRITLLNHYGPAETHVTTIARLSLSHSEFPPIGRAVGNHYLYILDENKHLVPAGVVGELYVGGAGLAKGYLNRPDLDEEKYIALPFLNSVDREVLAQPANSLLYKTGDLVRYKLDFHGEPSELEFLGRIDDQVKIRGFRVELGEVVSCITGHPEIADAAVLVKEGGGADKQLYAYIVLADAKRPATDVIQSVRGFLRQKLPDFMWPAAFIPTDEIPLNVNGKVDRNYLRRLSIPDQGISETNESPKSLTEKKLAGIFYDLLPANVRDVNTSFFKMGGHSLLATRLVYTIQSEWQIPFSIRTVFEYQTVRNLSREIDRLLRTKETDGGCQENEVIVAPIERNTQDKKVLSFAQQRLWFIDKLETSTAHYNIPCTLRLTGTLDEGALEQSIEYLVKKHQSLRTQIYEANGQAYQKIVEDFTVPFNKIDISQYVEPEKHSSLRKLIEANANHSFDITRDVLLRATLVKLEETEFQLLFCLHHIAADGWSVPILIEGFRDFYSAACDSKTPVFGKESRIQYTDYAHWQREWLNGHVLSEQLNYWKNQLADIPVLHAIPLDRPRPVQQNYRGEIHSSEIHAESYLKMNRFCESEEVTVFMLLYAAFNILLYRYSGQADQVVGTPIAGRYHKDLEPLVGFFINNLALRSTVNEEQSFGSFLRDCSQTVLDAYSHQYLPFERLVEELQPKRSLAHSPVFQIMLVLQNNRQQEFSLPGLKIEIQDQQKVYSKYDVELIVNYTANGLSLSWLYKPELFENESIINLDKSFHFLLDKLIEEPSKQIGDTQFLDEKQKESLLALSEPARATFKQSDPDLPIWLQVQKYARETPDATALLFIENRSPIRGSISYQKLNADSNQFMNLLLREKIGEGSRVGIFMHRSPELMTCLLAIQKIGATYVPIDLKSPQQRVEAILRDSVCDLLVTNTRHQSRLEHLDIKIIDIDSEEIRNGLAAEASGNPKSQHLSRAGLAYIIYTSGSTGTPKGVCASYKALEAYCRFALETYYRDLDRATPLAGAIFSTNIAFDATVASVYLPLLSGGTVLIAPEDHDIDWFWRYLKQLEEPYLVKLTPSHIDTLDNQQKEQCLTEHCFLVGGEALFGQHIKKIRSTFPHITIFNQYGPTETIVACSYHKVMTDKSQPETPIPIGKPLPGKPAYVLDQNLQLQPFGARGELYVGGNCLADGYLDQELTSERFVPNPFSTIKDAVLYKTGDLVRWNHWNELVFLGRNDTQIKLLGYRIDVGEIESRLVSQSNILAAAVKPLENNILVAYLVLQDKSIDSQEVVITSIKTKIAELLPIYMQPGQYMILERMPMTSNGKLDRNALPTIPPLNTQTANYLKPVGDLEKQLAGFWEQLLGRERIDRRDNFFSLGGHSLLATQLVSLIQNKLNKQVALRALFETPVLQDFAARVDHAGTTTIQTIPSVSRDQKLPLSFAQQRLWVFDQFHPESSQYNIMATIGLRGKLNKTVLSEAFLLIISRHEVLRTMYRDEEGVPHQVIDVVDRFDLPLFDLSALGAVNQDQRIDEISRQEQSLAFDLAHDIKIRASLIELSESSHRLLITTHHIASDGWSSSILLKELTRAYLSVKEKSGDTLPALPIQYADYASWQRKYLRGDILEQHLKYWSEELENLPKVHNLPLDFPRPAEQSYKGKSLVQVVEQKLSKRIYAVAEQHDATLFMVIHSAFSLLLYQISKQNDVVIGTSVANREQHEIQPLIGFFVNNLILRLDFSKTQNFFEILDQSKDKVLLAFEHQQLPFERLVDALKPERTLSYNPLFQILLTFQNTDKTYEVLPGLGIELLPSPNAHAQFDLMLNVSETEAGIEVNWNYAIDIFKEKTIQHMMFCFHELLAKICD